jgi:broad specificity phosphatase PhoE
MNLIEEIKRHQSESKLALLIRHGDREKIPEGEFGNEIALNEKGIKNSLAFGLALKNFPIKRILTSPIPRCVQTAKLISQGYGRNLEIVLTKSLGGPGLHITDEKLAGEFYLAHGFPQILERFTKNETVPGVSNAKDFSKNMTAFLKESTTENGLTLFITHDSLIAMYHFSLNGTIYTAQNWVDYLGGLIYKIES